MKTVLRDGTKMRRNEKGSGKGNAGDHGKYDYSSSKKYCDELSRREQNRGNENEKVGVRSTGG